MFIFYISKHALFFSFLILLFMLTFASAYIYLSISAHSFTLNLSIFSLINETLDASILLTPQSCLFSCVVAFISCVVYSFMPVYFQSSRHISYFNYFTLTFVVCMLILININDFFFVMLGWDGLGVSSYFLIAYYQSPNSLFSSSFTLMINRLGDCLLVVFLIFLWSSTPSISFIVDFSSVSSLLLFLALSTKSALFPFSPWLPAAMAAPTPISSLVHSSTLVTAGLFLLIQNNNILQSSSLSFYILTTCIFTSLYAGLASLVETDLKKVVALSTLSHLGFIGTSISLGIPNLAFFHLLTHAFFNSSLFLSVGTFIVSHGHYQDSRHLTYLSQSHPYFSSVALISEANLLGLPFLSGFYSNDLVLEFSTSYSTGTFLQTLLFLSVIFTFCYSLRVLLSLSQSTSQSPLSQPNTSLTVFMFLLSALSTCSVFFGKLQMCAYMSSEFTLPSSLKFLVPMLLLATLTMFFSASSFWFLLSNNFSLFFSTIFSLSSIFSNNTSRLFNSTLINVVSLESFISRMTFNLPVYLLTNQSSLIHGLFLSSTSLSSLFLSLSLLILVLLSLST